MTTSPRRRSPAALLALVLAALLLATGCVVGTDVPRSGAGDAPAPQSPPDGSTGAAEEQMARAVFDRVNAERAERDLGELAWNDDLAAVARDWNLQMAEDGRLYHQDLGPLLGGDRLAGFQALGENIFRATGPVPAGTIHAGWMRSDDHRVNVLNPGFDRLGVAVHCAPDGSVWATQEFGRTAGSDLPTPARTTPPPEPLVHPEDDGPTCG
ncbi:CAP domain-containing protein [Trujillonella humicola]|uniref:CAP domain-containing protein n=1 Tax=Trujillonella humicola TaxID=3383699 RepID=UPI003906129C